MKKKIIGCMAILFAFAAVSINSTAHAVTTTTMTNYFLNDTTLPTHHHMDSSMNKNKMKSKKMMHDSTNRMMNDSTNSTMDSTHR